MACLADAASNMKGEKIKVLLRFVPAARRSSS